MPLFVKDADFSQSLEQIFIRLPFHHHSSEEVDVTIFENYVKVAYPPHLFEAFLAQNVVDLSSSVRFEDEAIVLLLKKEKPGELWDKIALEITDKAELRKIREEAMKRLAEVTEERRKEKIEGKAEKGRENVRAQMKLEQNERERIEQKREMEKKLALSGVYGPPKEEEKVEKIPMPKAEPGKIVEVVEEKGNGKAIFTETSVKKAPQVPPPKVLPAVRSGEGRISVKFTPRVFPTPTRESQAQEEEAWLKKQAEARKIIELDEKELTENERDPEFMRKKADEFYKQGNFLAAANAYTHALRMRPNQAALYSNRAAAHLRAGNLMKCVEDASRALELFMPAVEANARERLLAHIRRGTALAKLELVVEGLADYQAALKLLPPDDPLRAGIERDAEVLRQHIQSSTN